MEPSLDALWEALPKLEFVLVRHAHTDAPADPNDPAADARREVSDKGREQVRACTGGGAQQRAARWSDKRGAGARAARWASERQCEEAGSRYFSKLTNVAFILHSPALRCRTTAKLVFQEQCRSINGNSPIMPVQRLYPPNAKNFRASAPEFAAAVATCEAAFDKLGYQPLRAYYTDPAVKAALHVYAVHCWREILQILVPRLRQNQHDFDPVQVLLFGHAVFTQALAVFVAEQRLCPPDQQAALLDVNLGEVDVITVGRRSCVHTRTHGSA